MLSQTRQKLIRSLQQKKHRLSERLFVAEGIKVIHDLLSSPFKTHSIYGTAEALSTLSKFTVEAECFEISEKELASISNQSAPEGMLALVYLDEGKYESAEWTLVLDAVNDPGNFGTIIRTARWFGIRNIFCTPGTVDAFNPKCVQAAKGSLFYINIYYRTVEEMLELFKSEDRQIFIADMGGRPAIPATGNIPKALVMGSESHGVKEMISQAAHAVVSIPPHADAREMDSLNVAVSCGILLSKLMG